MRMTYAEDGFSAGARAPLMDKAGGVPYGGTGPCVLGSFLIDRAQYFTHHWVVHAHTLRTYRSGQVWRPQGFRLEANCAFASSVGFTSAAPPASEVPVAAQRVGLGGHHIPDDRS